jgi:hypothetical protein
MVWFPGLNGGKMEHGKDYLRMRLSNHKVEPLIEIMDRMKRKPELNYFEYSVSVANSKEKYVVITFPKAGE